MLSTHHSSRAYTQLIGTMMVLVVIAVSYVVHIPEAHAGYPYFTTSVNVTSPKPPEVRKYNPGQAMQFTAQFGWAYCGNAGNFKVYGRTTSPVLVGREDTAFGDWAEIGSATGRKTYTNKFTAPMRPGVYRFRYQLEFGSPCVGIRGANCGGIRLMSTMRMPKGRGVAVANPPTHTYRRSGVVKFEVKDPTPPETTCPPNQIPTTRNGARVCVPQTLTVTCTSSATQARVGDTVSFAADSSAPATFTWYEGAGIDGAVIGGPETGTRSILSRTFTTPGQYQVTAYAQNANGAGMCTRGVLITDDEEDEDKVEVFDEFGNVVNEDGTRVMPDGTIISINPAAGPASIVFELDPALTNTTCGAIWTAQNVSACYLLKYNDRSTATSIGTAGNEQVLPATYRIECISLRDGRIASSEERICRQNLNVREL